ncbi:carbohydrate ABC transporter permease [Candidatus Pelagibacter sp. HIMB1748]|uniref:carbohydrate ABC transporter permease n=1 Tax=unclassified Candidatus Pelagibacter TaxID=2647897 RepID=UPI003F83FE08
MFPTPIHQRPVVNQYIYKIFLPISLIIWLIPIFGILMTSIRGLGDITAGNMWGTPSEFLLFSNLHDVFTKTPMVKYTLNSFKVTIPTMLGAVALSCMTGFALANYKFKTNLTIFFIFIAGNFVPFQILMIPVRDLTFKIGLYNTITGLVLFHVAFQTGFCTLFMRNFIKALPQELIEAARMDGASEFKIFWKIILPLTRPAIAALCVLIFTFIWNDYFWATVLIQGDHAMPITAGLKSLNGQWITAYHLLSTGSIVAAIPPVVMFFLMQKHFIAGLTLGATKG